MAPVRARLDLPAAPHYMPHENVAVMSSGDFLPTFFARLGDKAAPAAHRRSEPPKPPTEGRSVYRHTIRDSPQPVMAELATRSPQLT